MKGLPDDLDGMSTLDPASAGVVLAVRYRVVRPIGRGGMGSVYLAQDETLHNRPVAIKTLPGLLVANRRAVENLKREALLAMKLSHPNIVTLRAFEQTDEGAFLVMDYVEGETLDDRLAAVGKLDTGETLRIFGALAEAVDYAHKCGVVHRDLKPANILISADGIPYLTDFGVAREAHDMMTRAAALLRPRVAGRGRSDFRRAPAGACVRFHRAAEQVCPAHRTRGDPADRNPASRNPLRRTSQIGQRPLGRDLPRAGAEVESGGGGEPLGEDGIGGSILGRGGGCG